jgi:2-dehydro-3-deoxygalactonokinase
MADRFIAIDWGTTNRRVYIVEDGRAVETVRDDCGILAMVGRDYDEEIAHIRKSWGDLDVLIAGMAGSNRGWREAAYVNCPARIDDLAKSILWIEPRHTAIIPGVAARNGRPDVMRGEEVQLFGAITAHLVPDDALLCQPGTHCKWAVMEGAAITSFTTAMTGELFALLRTHSLLASQLDGMIENGTAFQEGVRDGRDHDLQSSLFGVRAAELLGRRSKTDAPSYTSGLLIGNDVAARNISGKTVYILADPVFGGLYAAAVTELDGSAVIIDSQSSFVAGVTAIRNRIL